MGLAFKPRLVRNSFKGEVTVLYHYLCFSESLLYYEFMDCGAIELFEAIFQLELIGSHLKGKILL